MNRITIAKGLTGLAVFGAALAAGAVAQAQPATSNGYYYDPCRRDQVQRGATGGILGAVIGGVLGNQIAAHGVRTEGSVLGGVVGAAIGSGIGHDSAACTSAYAPGYSANTYYNQGYAPAPVQGGYYDAPQAYYAPPPPPLAYYEPAPRYGSYGRGYGYGYGYRGGYYPQAYVAPSVGYSFTYVGR